MQDTGEFSNLFKMRWELQSCEGVNMVKSRGATEQSTLDERGQFHENSIPILKVEYSCIYNNLQNR